METAGDPTEQGMAGRSAPNRLRFECQTARHDGLIVITPRGEIDLSTAPELEAAIMRAAGASDGVCIDLSHCTFIDSTGLRVILTAARELRVSGGELSVAGLSGAVEKLFSITGLLLNGSPVRRAERPQAADPVA